MADDENNQPKKSRGILKILGFVFGGLFLVGAGLGGGFFLFGSDQPDPSEEIEQIIERKMTAAEEKKADSDKNDSTKNDKQNSADKSSDSKTKKAAAKSSK